MRGKTTSLSIWLSALALASAIWHRYCSENKIEFPRHDSGHSFDAKAEA
jgi:hypothetical protein